LTKKTPTPVQASWADALERFDDWQRAHGMGEKTRRAYGADLAQLADWAAERGLGPRELGHRELRHFAGVVSERGAASSSSAASSRRIRLTSSPARRRTSTSRAS
jgi:site-specific recombinase XerD